MPLPHGQRDYSTLRISRHALERFIERLCRRAGGCRQRVPERLRAPAG